MKVWDIQLAYPSTGEIRTTQVEANDRVEAGQKFFRRKHGAEMLPEGKVEITITEHIDVPPAKSYTREILIGLCEDGMTSMEKWHDRDSYSAHTQLGVAYSLLKCEVQFQIEKAEADTVWVEFYDIPGFNHVENREHEGDQYYDTERAYIPTRRRLERSGNRDWY